MKIMKIEFDIDEKYFKAIKKLPWEMPWEGPIAEPLAPTMRSNRHNQQLDDKQ